MSEIEVGEYVRIAGGLIAKVINKNNDGILIDKFIGEPVKQNTGTIRDWCIFNDEIRLIVKHSKNIIDLIEKGDYVNGIYIESNKGKYLETLEHDYENSDLGHIEYLKIYPYEIKSIVTKEQFENIEYKVLE